MPRTAVVTGASSAIGAATARRLATEGYRVVLAARRADRLEALAGQLGGAAVRVDVTDPSSVREFAQSLDSCEVLVNNAGGAIGAGHVAEAEPADWRAMFELNVLGTLHVVQSLLPLLEAGGTIVNITSTAAFANYEGGAGYCAAKQGQHALSETLRLELCGRPVRVIEIAPGLAHTEEFALDVAECVAFAVGLPPHVNIDSLVVRPLAEAAPNGASNRVSGIAS